MLVMVVLLKSQLLKATHLPTYVVLSAGLSGEVAYSGVVQSSDNTSKSISFSLDENASENTVYPFAADGIFDQHSSFPNLLLLFHPGVYHL